MTARARWSRTARSVAAGLVLAGSGLVALPAGGQEDPFAPDADEQAGVDAAMLLQYGWWNKGQQSPAGGNPTPPPPGAPADGIYVLYGPTGTPAPPAVTGPLGAVPAPPDPADVRPLGPEAFGAVRYAVPPGAEASLTLKYTPTSSSQPGGASTIGQLSACPISSSWDPVQNGRYDAAPVYDCNNGAPAVVAGDTLTFQLPAALAVDGVFDLALVPLGTQPYQLSIQPPSDSSMVLTSVPEREASEEAFDPGDFEDFTTFDDDGSSTFEGDDASSFALDDFGTTTFDDFSGATTGDAQFTAPIASGSVTRTPRRQVAVPAGSFPSPLDPNASRSERLMAVSLLLGLVAALWWVGGKPVRPPRLLGSLGAGAAASSEVVGARGIGRFSRVRSGGRPPRLF